MSSVLDEIRVSVPKMKNRILQRPITSDIGFVEQVLGLVIEAVGPSVSIGEACVIEPIDENMSSILAEVVGFKENKVLLMPFGEIRGIGPGSKVLKTGSPFAVNVGPFLLGSVVDGFGRLMGIQKKKFNVSEKYPVHQDPPAVLERRRIIKPVSTGIRAIDALLTVGEGQRIGIFAGSGVGKSTLLGMIARDSEADVNVIALIGERGREVGDFLKKDLGDRGLKKSVVVVSTSDQPALVRIQAALVATTIAEYFRDQGKRVMLMMDSVTRFAMAQREVGLAIGEPPTTKGYPPSVFALLPKLIERAGTTEHKGSITGIYSVLVEADDINEPIADTCRAILDGHVVLSRRLASEGYYPPIDILESVSRLMRDVASPDQVQAADKFRSIISIYKNAEDLISIGAYVKGTNALIDDAISKIDSIKDFLKQSRDEKAKFDETVKKMLSVLN